MTVAVLGCGPAGLLAAHACEEMGLVPTIYSRKAKSDIPGSQHLQGFIPGVTPHYPEYSVLFVRLGTAEGYAQKVYGDPSHASGWTSYEGTHSSWSVYNAYDMLWDRYQDRIIEASIDNDILKELLHEHKIVFSTLPAPGFCVDPEHHYFDGVPYWIKPLPLPIEDRGREVVVWNGLASDDWYRWSILGDRCSIESTKPMDGSIAGTKAIYNNCNCWSGIHKVGRWAKWKHGILLHHVYQEVKMKLESL